MKVTRISSFIFCACLLTSFWIKGSAGRGKPFIGIVIVYLVYSVLVVGFELFVKKLKYKKFPPSVAARTQLLDIYFRSPCRSLSRP